MHVLQSKHNILEPEKAKKLLLDLNISALQLPKIKRKDPALPKEANIGDIIKIERKNKDKKTLFYRVIIA